MRTIQLGIKRGFDVAASAVALTALTVIPVLPVIALSIKLTSKGPVIFVQERAGKDGKVFRILKFRTMLTPEESVDADGNSLLPSERITKVGAILRKTSLDELMQLINVLNGTMSLVGPRPTLPYQVERYDENQRRRLSMRPGLTGWAQVNGRNDLSWTEKIKYDLEYIDNFSLLFDAKIIIKTIGVVLGANGIDFTKNDSLTAKEAKADRDRRL